MQEWSNLSGGGFPVSTPSRQKGMCKVTTQKSLILIVDDFKDDREMYAHYLSRSGFRVSMASDGQEALDKAFQLLPDLILMDLWLPQIGGLGSHPETQSERKDQAHSHRGVDRTGVRLGPGRGQ